MSPAFDALLDVATTNGLITHAVGIAKFTYKFRPEQRDGALAPAEAEPLQHDFRPKGAAPPKVLPGSDFWRVKPATDFVVLGAAHAPRGVPVARMEACARIGRIEKRIAVFGKRALRWNAEGRLRIGIPEPFESVPLSLPYAYGGIDRRVPIDREDSLVLRMLLQVDHPGLYPRNPFGQGYLVDPRPVEDAELEMPRLEDPRDLLSAERLVVGDPRLWWKQPLPWCLDFAHPATFPRCLFLHFDADAWHPGPEDASLPEVQRGLVPPSFRSALRAGRIDGLSLFAQEASHGLVAKGLTSADRITLEGMDPEFPAISFSLGRSVDHTIDFTLEGSRERPRLSLHSIVARPAERTVSVVVAATVPLPRSFVPGVHSHVPIAISVDGQAPLHYQAPPSIRDQLRRAREATGEKVS